MRVDANQMANVRLWQTKARALVDNLALLGSRLEGRHSCLFVDLVFSVRARLPISR